METPEFKIGTLVRQKYNPQGLVLDECLSSYFIRFAGYPNSLWIEKQDVEVLYRHGSSMIGAVVRLKHAPVGIVLDNDGTGDKPLEVCLAMDPELMWYDASELENIDEPQNDDCVLVDNIKEPTFKHGTFVRVIDNPRGLIVSREHSDTIYRVKFENDPRRTLTVNSLDVEMVSKDIVRYKKGWIGMVTKEHVDTETVSVLLAYDKDLTFIYDIADLEIINI